VVGGVTYVGRGGLWEWCSACRSYVHASALVPDWWRCDLVVDLPRSTHSPEPSEAARLAAGADARSG
jgi:hypothetical protein